MVFQADQSPKTRGRNEPRSWHGASLGLIAIEQGQPHLDDAQEIFNETGQQKGFEFDEMDGLSGSCLLLLPALKSARLFRLS